MKPPITQCYAGTVIPVSGICPKCGADSGGVCWPGINADLDALRELRPRLEKAEWVLVNAGFRRCDIPACNCNSWHQVGGFKARFDEIREAVEEAGYSTNGRTLLDAVKEAMAVPNGDRASG